MMAFLVEEEFGDTGGGTCKKVWPAKICGITLTFKATNGNA